MELNFKKLIENIALTENQETDARTKYGGICKTLHDVYYPNTTYDGNTKLLIGSYGKSTNIRPPRDIDVLFKMPAEAFERFNKLSGNKQSQFLQEIRANLKGTYTTTEEIKAWGKVVSIKFSEGTHSVELLPGWKLDNGKYRIADTDNGGSWKDYNPVPELKNISNSNKNTGGKTIPLIRICKKWVEYCNVEIKSFIVEILVINYLQTLSSIDINQDYATLISNFFKYLVIQKNTIIIHTDGEIINLGSLWLSKAESAVQRSSKGVLFEGEGKLDQAVDEWKKIFGDDFQKVQTKKEFDALLLEDKIKTLQSQFPSIKEQFLLTDYGIPIRLNSSYYIKIDAEITQNGFPTYWLSEFLSKRFPILKAKKLLFSITKKILPTNYSIMWKVRNYGDEAQKANALRGEVTEDRGGENRVEDTMYKGEHYVECYVIENNICVAMDRILVPISS